MSPAATASRDVASLVTADRVHRAVYVDPDVFRLEADRVFRRVWLYVGHESEIPRSGDYVLSRLGPDEVILVRQADGKIAVLHNRCAHRGPRVVTEPRGNVRLFRCPYHSWAYRTDGSLAAVPMPERYPAGFDLKDPALGLPRVPRVESYRGFIFASQSDTGEDLRTFLGGVASALDNMVDRAPAGTVSRFGGQLRMEYRGNWKLFMENAVDLVHPGFVHGSSVDAARAVPGALDADGQTAQTAQMLLSNGLSVAEWDQVPLHAFPGGHVYMGGFYRKGVIAPQRADPVFDRYRASLVERHGEARTREILAVDRFNNLIWPNVSVNSRFAVMRIIQPVAVDRTIVNAICFRLDGAPDEMSELTLQFLNTAASSASMVASDDLEIFERCQRGLEDAAFDWLDVRRGAAGDRPSPSGESEADGTSELPIRNQLQAWKRFMTEARP